jgi:hypothetical protein
VVVILSILLLSNLNDQFVYSIVRLVLQAIGTVSVLTILLQAIGRVKLVSNSPEQRLRMVTIVLLLAEITGLITLSALLRINDPPPSNPALAAIAVMISASLAFGATIIAVTQTDEAETVTIEASEYEGFANWKRTIGDKLKISKAEYMMYQQWKSLKEVDSDPG